MDRLVAMCGPPHMDLHIGTAFVNGPAWTPPIAGIARRHHIGEAIGRSDFDVAIERVANPKGRPREDRHEREVPDDLCSCFVLFVVKVNQGAQGAQKFRFWRQAVLALECRSAAPAFE
jgi:hypothetical protein